ncbi:bombyxin A-7-like [Amphibalanus amphitrite]|uniref:bombyxin A-7-like n=1 Tax=Amphibalanus amphitrite TaxID=1232801 RepID=UPI001C90AC8C|nr:bombyxin A-7-like [Amphibalanus amphitrite]
MMSAGHVVPLTLLLAACLHTSLSLHRFAASLEKKATLHYCGENLADMLEQLCQGSSGKRSPLDTPEESDMAVSRGFLLPSLRSSFEFLRRLSSRGQRRKRGIVDECCTRPCSVSTLREFC